MLENDVWTPQEIADEIGRSRQFVIDVIIRKTKSHQISARKMGRSWVVADGEARRFIDEFRSLQEEFYTPLEIAEAIGKSRIYVQNALTGYGGKKDPTLNGEKRGDRWVVKKKEGDRFIKLHGKNEG